jgi:hypothetical protein
VLTDLSPFERDLLDAYEGDEYRRDLIPVVIEEELHEVFSYLPSVTIAANSPSWALKTWQAEHKPRVLIAERAMAEQLRLKLIAVRPH